VVVMARFVSALRLLTRPFKSKDIGVVSRVVGIAGCCCGGKVLEIVSVKMLLRTSFMMSVVVDECGSFILELRKAWPAETMAFLMSASKLLDCCSAFDSCNS